MDAVISLLIFSLLPQLVVPEVPTIPYRAIVEIVSGNPRIFSGEHLRLRCNIPDVYNSSWSYLWFRGTVQLPQSGQILQLWNAHIKESDKYSCQGQKMTLVGKQKTQRSLPEEINVDGGFVILETPQHPVLVGDVLDLKCRLRMNPPVHQTILYKDGVQVMVQRGSGLNFRLTNVSLEDVGMYSCRVSWDIRRSTVSVMSVPTAVYILEVLTQPVLEITEENILRDAKKMNLICHVQYNAPAPAPPVNYYFYKNNKLLGPATSQDHLLIRRAPGWYTCRVRVPKLNIVRWSEPKSYGDVPEPQLMSSNHHHHPNHHHTTQMAPSPSTSHLHPFLSPASQPATPKYFAATQSFDQHTEGSEQSSMDSELPVSSSPPPPDQFPDETKTPEP
ncbi:putative high affinity immunoglobulin gamma Fc receptor IB [Fundulus diaphanus]